MQERNIYSDIAKRTQGDIYIGVVGPVRTGKSTFIKRFMDALVLPNIESQSVRDRATDELPQSAAGRTIMTTEPKFIPENAVEISLQAEATFRVRLIDCVGYIVPSSLGYIEAVHGHDGHAVFIGQRRRHIFDFVGLRIRAVQKDNKRLLESL